MAKVNRVKEAHFYFKTLRLYLKPFYFLFALISLGTLGYMTLEQWSFLDSIFMTMITISTVGFHEVHPLDDAGRYFTMLLIVGGVFIYGYAINNFFKIVIERRFRQFLDEQRMKDKIKKMNNHYIICGGGRMALAIGKELEKTKKEFLFIEINDNSPVSKAISNRERDWPLLHRDALLEDSLIEARIEQAKGLFSVLNTDADNLFVVLSAKTMNPNLYIETRISQESTRKKMLQAGADKVTSPYTVGGIQMVRNMLQPDIDEFLEVILDKSNYEFELNFHVVKKSDDFANKILSDTKFRDQGFTVIGVKKLDKSMELVPSANFVLRPGHELLLIGRAKEFEINDKD